MSQEMVFDAIVVGSGQGGSPLAVALAGSGRKTAIIERENVGGTCVNNGCTPTKTMVMSAKVAYLARRGAEYGVETAPLKIQMETVRKRKRDIVRVWRGGSESRLKDAKNLTLIRGEASFAAPGTLRVKLPDGGEQTLKAKEIFLNTGLSTAVPKIDGIENVPYLTSSSVMELGAVPEHLLVLGGGYIGVEFAQMFRRFGAEVTILQSAAHLLPQEDEEISAEVEKILTEDGIHIVCQAKVTRAEGSNGGVRLTAQTRGGEQTFQGSHLLLAAGRKPNTEALNLQAGGVATDEKGFVKVNEFLETSAEGVWALGDVKGGPAFTHVSYDDFRVIRTNVLEGGRRSICDRILPYTVYMDPQLGRVGMTEKQARDAGLDVKVARMPWNRVARAYETAETRGLMKIVVDAKSEQIVGAAVLGGEGGEIAALLQVAMWGKLPYTVLKEGMFAHPTYAESLNNALQSLE